MTTESTPTAATVHDEPVRTQPMPPAIDAARRALTAVLEAGPAVEDAVTITEALHLLLDVEPPYPPLGLEDDPTEPDVGIPAALTHLDHAAQAATSVRDLTRYAVIALLLQQASGAVTP